MNKKGIFTLYALVFVILSVGAGIYFVSSIAESNVATLGKSQANLLNSYSSAEIDLFNYEQFLKYNFKEIISELGSSGGVLGQDSIGGHTYWQKGSKKCYPSLEDLKKNLGLLIGDEDIIIDDSEILIYYNNTYSFSENGIEINYYFTPVLKFDYDYPLTNFLDRINEVDGVVDICGEDISCWETEFKYECSISKEGNVILIDIDAPKINDVFGEKEIVIKGAVDFGFNPLIDEFECK